VIKENNIKNNETLRLENERLQSELIKAERVINSQSQEIDDVLKSFKPELESLVSKINEEKERAVNLTINNQEKDSTISSLKRSVEFLYNSISIEEQRLDHEKKMIEINGLFDSEWYLANNKDVSLDKNHKNNPLLHYLKYGESENRLPSSDVNIQNYIKSQHGKFDGINPLIHYLLNGMASK